MYKYDLHIHTSECDKVALTDAAEIVRLYKDIGYDGIVITDHYFSLFFEWFGNEIDENNQKSIIERYLKGYYNAKNEAEKIGFKVFCGAEVRFDGTINDYLVYGLCEKDFYNLPLLNRLKNAQELVSALPDYAVIVQAHPFRDNMTVQSPVCIDGIEGYNGCTEKIRNDLARQFASHYNKIITSGSDFHGPDQLAKGGIATYAEIKTSHDLADILKNGNFELVENY